MEETLGCLSQQPYVQILLLVHECIMMSCISIARPCTTPGHSVHGSSSGNGVPSNNSKSQANPARKATI
eukprot:2379983-Amphidinium_carterae.1